MTDNIPQGSLEQLGIHVETQLPQGVMSPADSKGVRFTATRPGYHFREVEAYKEAVDTTLETYAAILHARDMDVYNLGAELDRARVDILNLRHQIEVYEYKGGVAEADATDEEVETLLNNNAMLQAKIDELEEANKAMDEWATTAQQYVADLETRLAYYENGGEVPVEVADEPIAEIVEESVIEEPVVEVEEVYEEETIEVPGPASQVAPDAPLEQKFPGITEDDLR